MWSASGGTGEYEFYLGVVSEESRLEGPRYEFDSQAGHKWPPNTFIVVSGGVEDRVTIAVELSDCGF